MMQCITHRSVHARCPTASAIQSGHCSRHRFTGVRCASTVSPTASTTSTSSTEAPPSWGRRGVLSLFIAAATAVKLDSPAAAAAAAAPAAAVDQEETVGSRAIREYTELEAKGKFKDRKALDDFRARYNIRRALDGRVSVRNKKGEWFSVRLDMEVAGALLMRDEAGFIYAVTTDNIQQVDLSDDFVVMLMFADSEWETQLTPIQLTDEDGKTIQLQLDDRAFRDVLGILKEMQEGLDEEGDGSEN